MESLIRFLSSHMLQICYVRERNRGERVKLKVFCMFDGFSLHAFLEQIVEVHHVESVTETLLGDNLSEKFTGI